MKLLALVLGATLYTASAIKINTGAKHEYFTDWWPQSQSDQDSAASSAESAASSAESSSDNQHQPRKANHKWSWGESSSSAAEGTESS